ncbi:MAG TPA: cytochrome c biogenesis protein CcsA [Phycisphaerae bacterium]|nr:cytochrome c biogenesis protein CcsA [Phycisphaerae bacterium]
MTGGLILVMMNAALALGQVPASGPAGGGPTLPGALNLDKIRALPVQHEGRWPPLDTVARDIVTEVTGSAEVHGRDPLLVLLAWTFEPQAWRQQPVIPIKNRALRRELQLPETQTAFSFSELVSHQPLMSLIRKLGDLPPGSKLDPLRAKVKDLNDRLLLLQDVFRGTVIRPIPDPNDARGRWLSIPEAGMHAPDRVKAVSAAWNDLRTAFLADDGPGVSSAADRLRAALAALPSAFTSSPQLIARELRYNQLHPFRLAWHIMIAGAILAALAAMIQRRWFDAVAVIGMLAGFACLSYGLWMRWQIAGRLPASNMFESLLFLSWGMGAFAILALFVFPHRIVPLTASAMGALALVLADVLLDHSIRPIPPVLQDTIWMSIHVPIIMVSYSVLALGVLFAHAQVVTMAVAPGKRAVIETIDALHYWYIHVGSILLLAGIVTGSMWAASSWGRYWGWDPKEVWSLVALLGYLAILHVRVDREARPWWMYVIGVAMIFGLLAFVAPPLAPMTPITVLALGGTVVAAIFFVIARSSFATAVKSILAFWLIIMTYVGVNFVLGTGLHSYGFGTGVVAQYMFWVGGIDLAFILLCAAVYSLGRTARSSVP